MRAMIRGIAAALACAPSLTAALPARAQDYPAKAVRVVVAFPPGSSTDVVARIVTAMLSEIWGQPVVAENRAGAGGSIASTAVARAAPDGYTLLVNSAAHTINPVLMPNLPYDTSRDFTDISPLSTQPNVLVVSPSSPHKSLADLVRFAHAKPGAITFAHGGIGSGTHLHAERFLAAAGVKALLVPFKGTPEIVAAIMGGNVDCYWLPISAGIGAIRAGNLRALAIGSSKRSPLLPEVPTTTEAGFTHADVALWFGLWGPAGMPAPLVAKISADVRKTLNDPRMREKLANLGSEPLDMSPREFSAFLRQEALENRRLLELAGVKPE
jgi:tripartite-type tricarboxylate transporter receptor subunit TctC